MFVRQNLVSGTLTAGISDVDTSFSSVELAELVEVAAPDKVRVVLDPLGDDAGPEIVDVTAHIANSLSATVVRAVEDSARFPAVEHPVGTRWIVADTVETLPSASGGFVWRFDPETPLEEDGVLSGYGTGTLSSSVYAQATTSLIVSAAVEITQIKWVAGAAGDFELSIGGLVVGEETSVGDSSILIFDLDPPWRPIGMTNISLRLKTGSARVRYHDLQNRLRPYGTGWAAIVSLYEFGDAYRYVPSVDLVFRPATLVEL